jgi:hypothetical protein
MRHTYATKQGSISFLKKRNKKLLLCWLTRLIRLARIEESKSFLVLFFKKELLSCRPSFGASHETPSNPARNCLFQRRSCRTTGFHQQCVGAGELAAPDFDGGVFDVAERGRRFADGH